MDYMCKNVLNGQKVGKSIKKDVKRPSDVNQLAKFIVDVATGEREASIEVDPSMLLRGPVG